MNEITYKTDVKPFIGSLVFLGNSQEQCGFVKSIEFDGDRYNCTMQLFKDYEPKILNILKDSRKISYGYKSSGEENGEQKYNLGILGEYCNRSICSRRKK